MKEGYKKWDVVEHLNSEEDIQLFWDGILEDSEGNPEVIVRALDAIARARNINQLAKDTGLTRAGIYKALSPDGDPKFHTISKIMGGLGLGWHASSSRKASDGTMQINSANGSIKGQKRKSHAKHSQAS